MPANSLPSQPTPFIGREKELAEIATLLADPNCRLLTLVGPGGIGKTRLAIQVAAHQQPHFVNGVAFVPLAPVGSPDLLPAAIAGALDTAFYGSEKPMNQIIHYLREKQILLALDNFEHLLDSADLLTEMLQSAANVKILVTSRERLNLQEEWVFALDGLSYPTESVSDSLENYSAVQLFVQRAHQVQAHFAFDQNAQAVLTICRQVEGMPLGLELAASWLRVMSCQQIVAQMGGSLDFLTTPLRNIPERHRSLRMVFEQSWRFLSGDEQSILMKLSVFRGGFDLEAAEQVAGASLPLLAGLADKSLIRLNADGRYDLHELLRQYAADKLLDAGETNITVQRHLDYFLKLAEEAEAHEFGREQILWFDRLEIELDNIRAALTWSVESEKGLRLAAALGWFFSERSHWVEGLNWLEQMLAANEDAPASLRAKALHSAGSQALMLGDNQKVRILCEQALNLARAANDRWNIAWSLSHMSFRFEIDGNSDQSRAALEESLSLFRELQDPMGLCHNLVRRAFVALDQRREYAYVSVLIDEASIYAQKADDKIILGWIEYLRGMVYWLQDNDVRQAKIHYESSLSFFREARFWGGVNLALSLVASVEHLIGDDALAQTHFKEALILQHEIMDTMEDSLIGLASLASARGQFLRAAKLLGAARNNIMISAIKLFPEIFAYERDVDALRTQLGEVAFDEAWAAGQAMTTDQAVAYALEGRTMPAEAVNNRDINQPPQANNPAVIESLSARELEVLRLIAEGLSNAEIAQKLFLTVGTVKVHSRNIYGKLGANNRTQAVAQAQKLNLL